MGNLYEFFKYRRELGRAKRKMKAIRKGPAGKGVSVVEEGVLGKASRQLVGVGS